jgi:hypothetical protein
MAPHPICILQTILIILSTPHPTLFIIDRLDIRYDTDNNDDNINKQRQRQRLDTTLDNDNRYNNIRHPNMD